MTTRAHTLRKRTSVNDDTQRGGGEVGNGGEQTRQRQRLHKPQSGRTTQTQREARNTNTHNRGHTAAREGGAGTLCTTSSKSSKEEARKQRTPTARLREVRLSTRFSRVFVCFCSCVCQWWSPLRTTAFTHLTTTAGNSGNDWIGGGEYERMRRCGQVGGGEGEGERMGGGGARRRTDSDTHTRRRYVTMW